MRDAPFYVIERGLVEFVDRKPGKDVDVAQADSHTFIGDIAAFTGEPTISACVAVEPTDVIAFDRAGLRDMVARWPELGEHIFRTLLARRDVARGRGTRRHAPDRPARLAPVVRGARPARAQPAAGALVRRRHRRGERRSCSSGSTSRARRRRCSCTPPHVMRNPSAAQVARSLGLRAEVDGERFDLVVLGAGPAGLAAAVYGGSEGLRTFVAEAWAPGRPGRHEHADRELPRLPERDLRDGADAQRDAPGAPLRRGALELPQRGRAGGRARGPGAGRPRRRPARARPLRRDGHRRPLARAGGRGRRAIPRRGRLPRDDGHRRGALPRRGRDRRRRRQLGGTGRDAPRQAWRAACASSCAARR